MFVHCQTPSDTRNGIYAGKKHSSASPTVDHIILPLWVCTSCPCCPYCSVLFNSILTICICTHNFEGLLQVWFQFRISLFSWPQFFFVFCFFSFFIKFIYFWVRFRFSFNCCAVITTPTVVTKIQYSGLVRVSLPEYPGTRTLGNRGTLWTFTLAYARPWLP